METKSLVDTLDDKLPEAEANRHWDILGDVKAEAETLNDTLVNV